MSNKIGIIAVAVVVTVLTTALVIDADDKRQAIISALGNANLTQCGIEKLTDQERNNLFRVIGSFPVASYTQAAAEAYLKRHGWRQVQVIGAVVVDTVWDEKHILVSDNYDLFLLDPSIVPNLPDPGVYWAESSGSAWKLIFPDGDEGSFWAEELD
ncbi:MAG: hypothetical protein AB1772_07605 [Candidatus Zixiibacteriota bacterium]